MLEERKCEREGHRDSKKDKGREKTKICRGRFREKLKREREREREGGETHRETDICSCLLFRLHIKHLLLHCF